MVVETDVDRCLDPLLACLKGYLGANTVAVIARHYQQSWQRKTFANTRKEPRSVP